MKRIDATVRPHHLDAVKSRLAASSLQGITATEVLGTGGHNGHPNAYRGTVYAVEFAPSIQLTIVAPEDKVASIVAAIREVAAEDGVTGGTIVVSSIDEVIRIRTGERGRSAL